MDSHLYFNAELAVCRACKVMYAAASILNNKEIKRVDELDIYREVNISKSRYKKLSKLRNFDGVAFAYVVETLRLIEGDVIK